MARRGRQRIDVGGNSGESGGDGGEAVRGGVVPAPVGGGGGGGDGGDAGKASADSGAGAGGGGGSDRLVKKGLRLNQLAVYWNPAEDGNPCSMHLSDIPVEQAEVVISRQGVGGNCWVLYSWLDWITVTLSDHRSSRALGRACQKAPEQMTYVGKQDLSKWAQAYSHLVFALFSFVDCRTSTLAVLSFRERESSKNHELSD